MEEGEEETEDPAAGVAWQTRSRSGRVVVASRSGRAVGDVVLETRRKRLEPFLFLVLQANRCSLYNVAQMVF